MGGVLAAEKLLVEFANRHQPAGKSTGFRVIAGYPGTKEQSLAGLKVSRDKLSRGTDTKSR